MCWMQEGSRASFPHYCICITLLHSCAYRIDTPNVVSPLFYSTYCPTLYFVPCLTSAVSSVPARQDHHSRPDLIWSAEILDFFFSYFTTSNHTGNHRINRTSTNQIHPLCSSHSKTIVKIQIRKIGGFYETTRFHWVKYLRLETTRSLRPLIYHIPQTQE